MSQIFFKKVDVVNATNTFLDQLVSLLKEPARKLHAGYGLSARDALVWRQSGTGVMVEKAAHRVSFAAEKWEQTVRDNVQMLMLEVARQSNHHTNFNNYFLFQNNFKKNIA